MPEVDFSELDRRLARIESALANTSSRASSRRSSGEERVISASQKFLSQGDLAAAQVFLRELDSAIDIGDVGPQAATTVTVTVTITVIGK